MDTPDPNGFVINTPVATPQSPLPSSPTKKVKIPRWTIMLIITLVVFGAVFLTLASVTVYGQVKLPFVSDGLRQQAVLLLYRLPLLPKTPEQILTNATYNEGALTTYEPDFSVSASLGGTGVSTGSLDVHLTGPVDFNPKNKLSFALNADIGVNFAGTFYEGKGHVRKVEDMVYFKLDSLSDSVLQFTTTFPLLGGLSGEIGQPSSPEIKANLDRVFSQWVTYDTQGLSTEARKQLETNSRNQSLIDSTRKNIQTFLLKREVLPQVKLLPNETIEGVTTYHLQLVPSADVVRTLALDLATQGKLSEKDKQRVVDSIVQGIESIEINAWFGKSDGIVRKLTLQTQVNIGTLFGGIRESSLYGSPMAMLGSLMGQKLTVSTALVMKNIGQPVTVSAPTPIVSVQEFTQQLQDATKTESQKQDEAQKKQFSLDAKSVSNALTKYYIEDSRYAYPATLSQLVGTYINQNDDVSKRFTAYTYKILKGGQKYALYIEVVTTGDAYGSTPYYGITSDSTYPHYLQEKDFN